MRFVYCWDMSETRLQKGFIDLIGGKLLPGESVPPPPSRAVGVRCVKSKTRALAVFNCVAAVVVFGFCLVGKYRGAT